MEQLNQLREMAEHDEVGRDLRDILTQMIDAISRLGDRVQVLEEELQLAKEKRLIE